MKTAFYSKISTTGTDNNSADSCWCVVCNSASETLENNDFYPSTLEKYGVDFFCCN